MTIIDDDEPGVLSFTERVHKVIPEDKKILLKVQRQHGSDGIVKCKFETQNATNVPAESVAKPYEQYTPMTGLLVFAHGEKEKEIEIELLLEKKEGEELIESIF